MDLDTTRLKDGEYLRHSTVEHFCETRFFGASLRTNHFKKTRLTSLEKNSICKGTKLILLC